MRPVNLIPPEERRGDRAPTRTGPIAYVLVGALALALGAVTLVVLTNNKIADRQDQVAALEEREAAATQRAEALAPYTEFASLKEARVQTVNSLARSRFDWERVLRELALVLPPDVQLTNVTGTVSPEVTLQGGGGSALRDAAEGPALAINGCASSHKTVAELAAALEDIDGVTRVGVANSSESQTESGGAPSSSVTEGCQTTKAVAQFEMLAAFDAVPAPGTSAPVAPPAESVPTGNEAGVDSAQQQEQQARDSVEKQDEKVDHATNLIPGTVR